MKKWEYKHVNAKMSETELNQLGRQGWELVSHTGIATSDFLGGAGQFKQYYVFKRPIEDE